MTDGTAQGGWDHVVVGAGSAGATLASRLTEHPQCRVLLVEAGTAQRRPAQPPPLGKAILLGENWDYDAYLGAEAAPGARQFPYRVGKVIGGSSAVNGAIALRGLPEDFDRWAAAGNPEWAWSRVLPYFVKLEADADFKGPEHGTEGQIPVRRTDPAQFNALAHAFHRACRDLGLPDLPDLNADARVGVGPMPTNSEGGRRMSTADTYLAAARGRANLEVWPGCQVGRVLLDRGRAVGVELVRDGVRQRVSAGQVTLCAGAVNTPGILERTGIGAADRLAGLGIRPVVDLPGVGENLGEHPTMGVWAVPRPGVCADGEPWHSTLARVTSGGDRPDLMLSMLNNVATAGVPVISEILGGRIAVTIAASLLGAESRGSVHVTDAAPDAPPLILLNLLGAPEDLERLVTGTRMAWRVLRSPEVADLLERVVIFTDRMITDDTMLRRSLPKFVAPMWHPTGTARMGRPGDESAVVDQYCRVRGVDGLRVVDASVMPSIPAAPTNLTCIMIAERVAGWMV